MLMWVILLLLSPVKTNEDVPLCAATGEAIPTTYKNICRSLTVLIPITYAKLR